MILTILSGVFVQGLIYGLVVMAVYFSMRVIKRDDLSVEGSFGLGGAVMASFLVSHYNPSVGLLAATAVGALCGFVTGFLHTKLKLNHLISGMILTTGAFSLCLHIAGANTTIPDNPFWEENFIYIMMAIVGSLLIVLRYLLDSDVGLLLRTTGENPQMIVSLAKKPDFYIMFGFILANALTGLAGALLVQYSGFYSITGNVGTLLIGISGLIIGEIFGRKFGLGLILGSFIFQSLFAVTIEFEVDPKWNNLIKAALITFLIWMRSQEKKKTVHR